MKKSKTNKSKSRIKKDMRAKIQRLNSKPPKESEALVDPSKKDSCINCDNMEIISGGRGKRCVCKCGKGRIPLVRKKNGTLTKKACSAWVPTRYTPEHRRMV